MTWNLQNIRGTKEAVKAKVNSEKIPAEVKAFIGARIDSQPDDTLAVILNGYSQSVVHPKAVKVTEIIQIALETIRV
jgi:hypothetical protein